MRRSLKELEAEVEAARAKLATDVAILQSDATRTQFLDSAQEDFHRLKDRVVSSAANSAQSTVTDMIESLKAKAAQNPAAVLAVAAGLGWRFHKKPPITSVLVGLGLYSLLTSKAERTAEPLETAKRRAKEQVATAAEVARSSAASVASSILEKVDELTQPARDATGEMLDEARGRLHDAQDAIAEKANSAHAFLKSSSDSLRTEGIPARNDTQLQDTALLALAGVAVAATVGLAWQKRTSVEPVLSRASSPLN